MRLEEQIFLSMSSACLAGFGFASAPLAFPEGSSEELVGLRPMDIDEMRLRDLFANYGVVGAVEELAKARVQKHECKASVTSFEVSHGQPRHLWYIAGSRAPSRNPLFTLKPTPRLYAEQPMFLTIHKVCL